MRIKLAVVFAITVASLVWVLWGIDLSVVAGSLQAFRWSLMIGVLGLYFVAHALRVIRLRTILGVPMRFWSLFSIVSIGYLAIHVVPLRMGEFVRPYLLTEQEKVPFGKGIAAIFIERLLDMLMLLAMLLLVGFAVELPPSSIVVNGIDVLRAGQRFAGTLVAGGVLGLVALFVVGEPILRLTDKLPVGGFLRRFDEGIRSLARRPAAFASTLVISVVIWIVTVAAVDLSLAAFPGLPSGAGLSLTTWSVTLAGMTAVPTPGFFGGFEACCAAALELVFHADADRARTFAVILHLGQFGFTVVTGVWFLLVEGLSLRDLVGRSRESMAG